MFWGRHWEKEVAEIENMNNTVLPKQKMSVCNRVQVTKIYEHFIRLMSTMEERKDSTQTNILKFIVLCDIVQTFKSRHQIAILVIQAFRAVWFVPFVLVVLPYPVVRLANTLNQLFGDTMVTGMPPRPAPLLTKNAH